MENFKKVVEKLDKNTQKTEKISFFDRSYIEIVYSVNATEKIVCGNVARGVENSLPLSSIDSCQNGKD